MKFMRRAPIVLFYHHIVYYDSFSYSWFAFCITMLRDAFNLVNTLLEVKHRGVSNHFKFFVIFLTEVRVYVCEINHSHAHCTLHTIRIYTDWVKSCALLPENEKSIWIPLKIRKLHKWIESRRSLSFMGREFDFIRLINNISTGVNQFKWKPLIKMLWNSKNGTAAWMGFYGFEMMKLRKSSINIAIIVYLPRAVFFFWKYDFH